MSKIYGIRFDHKEYQIGDELPKSRRWDLGVPTDELLSGTSAIYLSDDEEEAMEKLGAVIDENSDYPGDHAYLVYIEPHWGWEWGEDENEIVMNGAEVLKKIR